MSFLKSFTKRTRSSAQSQRHSSSQGPELNAASQNTHDVEGEKFKHDYTEQQQLTSEKSDTSHSIPNPPPYESWFSIPDPATLPPPPSLHDKFSPTNNASRDSAEAGHEWCDRYPVYSPGIPKGTVVESVRSGHIDIAASSLGPSFKGSIVRKHQVEANGRTLLINTPLNQDDACLLSSAPLYFAGVQNPLLSTSMTSKPVVVGYSIRIVRVPPSSVIAIGLSNAPYPPFRLPGWHRGSLAIHSDDGHRYINDPEGGTQFVPRWAMFQAGDVVILRVTIQPVPSPLQGRQLDTGTLRRVDSIPRCRTRVGLEIIRSDEMIWEGGWDVHEEADASVGGVEGLQGDGDLYASLGICGECEVEMSFSAQLSRD